MAEPFTVYTMPQASGGLWADAARRLLHNRLAMVGLALVTLAICATALAPWIAPYAPNLGSLADGLQRPSLSHLMGTDTQGRDEFSRILYGGRISLTIGFGSVAIAALLGSMLGLIAGVAGGRLDSIAMRVVDVFLAIPGILFAIGFVAFFERGLTQVMFAVALANAPVFARLLRASLLAVREADYVTAARSVGVPWQRIVMRHMLPNAVTPVIVAASLLLGTAILEVAGLGFLGLGAPDPRTAEWGAMLQESTKFLRSAQYLIFFPGLAIILVVVGFNLFGDGLRELLDPRLKV